MVELEEASARLDDAVSRLSRALHDDADRAPGGRVEGLADSLDTAERERDVLKTDIAALKGDQERLSVALREAQENYAALKLVNEAVAGRLDGAIGELKLLLNK